MVMIDTDAHKRTRTVVALDEVDRRLGSKTVPANSEAIFSWWSGLASSAPLTMPG